MTTIRAKLAAIGLALAAAGAFAALSPAGPAVADASPACQSPDRIEPVLWHDGTTKYYCVKPNCTIIVWHFHNPDDTKVDISCPSPSAAQSDDATTVRSSQGVVSDRQNGPDRHIDRQVIKTGQHAASPSASG
jgi:hypothetical protein